MVEFHVVERAGQSARKVARSGVSGVTVHVVAYGAATQLRSLNSAPERGGQVYSVWVRMGVASCGALTRAGIDQTGRCERWFAPVLCSYDCKEGETSGQEAVLPHSRHHILHIRREAEHKDDLRVGAP